MTTFLQRENHNISQSWEHKQYWSRAEMFQQQKMTGENVPWMVFAHQGRAAVTVLQCFMEGVKSSRIPNVKWGKGRLQDLLCHTEVTLFPLFVNSLSNFTCVLYSAVEQWLEFQVAAARQAWGHIKIQISRNTLTAEVEDPMASTPLFFEGKNTDYFWRATGHNLCLFGFSVTSVCEVLFYLSLHKPQKMC